MKIFAQHHQSIDIPLNPIPTTVFIFVVPTCPLNICEFPSHPPCFLWGPNNVFGGMRMILQVVNGNIFGSIHTYVMNVKNSITQIFEKIPNSLKTQDIASMIFTSGFQVSIMFYLCWACYKSKLVRFHPRPNKLSVLPHSGHTFAHVHRP